MNCPILKRCFIFLNLTLFLSCGVKSDVKPLPEPEYEVLRIGEMVYLIPKNREVMPEGFRKEDGFFLRRERKKFCFEVKHVEGKSELACVGRAVEEKPSVELRLTREEAVLLFKDPGRYRIYPFRGELIPRRISEVKGDRAVLKRGYKPYKVAVTKVINGSESPPVIVEIAPREPPKPSRPEGLKLVVRGGKLYLYWWSEEDVRFLVYKNGELVTPEPTVQNVFVDDLPREKTTYEIRAVNEFGVKSEPVRIIYKP